MKVMTNCIPWLLSVPHDNSAQRIPCESTERIHFQTDTQLRQSTWYGVRVVKFTASQNVIVNKKCSYTVTFINTCFTPHDWRTGFRSIAYWCREGYGSRFFSLRGIKNITIYLCLYNNINTWVRKISSNFLRNRDIVRFQRTPLYGPGNSLGRLGGCLTLRSLTLYIYGAPILDVSRSHTTTQHSR